MAYSDIALLANDQDFRQRIAAAASVEQVDMGEDQPVLWAMNHQWQFAAVPGFGDKYAYAIATGVVRPGNDPTVITDPDILSAMQALFPDALQDEPE